MTTENKTRTFNDDPDYFGAYLSMARHNLFLICNEVANKFPDLKLAGYNSTRITDDEDIVKPKLNILLNIFSKEYAQHEEYRDGVFHYLKQFLPLIKVFNPEDLPKTKKGDNTKSKEVPNIQFEALQQFLVQAFPELSSLRDAHTHYFAFDNETKQETPRKKGVEYNELKDEIKNLFSQASLYSFYNFESTQEQVPNSHEMEDFEHLKTYQLFEENSLNFTQKGFCFFICSFLERKHAYQFLKKIPGFKNETIRAFKATLKNFTAYSIKLPTNKLISQDPTQALLLDMLNELNKCPQELYSHLPSQLQAEFNPNLSDDAKNNTILNSRLEQVSEAELDQAITQITARIRKQDRFNYFALRFLDETQAFDRIRFQVRLGKVLLTKYPKQILGIANTRKIEQDLNAFGRLGDFLNSNPYADLDEQKLELLKEINPQNIPDINIEQLAPHYHIQQNNIGFYFGASTKAIYPTIAYNGAQKPILQQQAPHCFISTHELPKMALLQLLQKGAVEQTIEKFIEKQNKFFDITYLNELKASISTKLPTPQLARRIQDQYKINIGVKLSNEEKGRALYAQKMQERKQILDEELAKEKMDSTQLPSKMVDYLLGITEGDDAEQRKLNIKVKELRGEIKELEHAIKIGKQPKIGEMATYIAKDILYMLIDERLKQNITSVYYNKLQNKLAYFGAEKATLISLCKELNLFDKAKGHVFLTIDLLQKHHDIFSLYQAYIAAKKKWIEDTFVKVVNRKTAFVLPSNKPLPYILSKQFPKPVFNFEAWLAEKKLKPIDLPTQLFDKAIERIMSGKMSEVKELPQPSFSKLLQAYTHGDTQPFYNYERTYKIYQTELTFKLSEQDNFKALLHKHTNSIIQAENKNRKEKQLEKMSSKDKLTLIQAKDVIKKGNATITENEKTIRFIQNKDRVMRLMCEKLLEGNENLRLQSSLYLSQIHPNSLQNPLDSSAEFKYTIKGKIEDKTRIQKTIIAKNNAINVQAVQEWRNGTNQSTTNKIGYTWTLKDFGAFNKWLHDRRLLELLSYFAETEIPISMIEYQLDAYDQYRPRFFEAIFNLEKAIVTHDRQGIMEKSAGKDHKEVQFDVYTNWLAAKGWTKETDYLQHIRNKVSHSQFPQKSISNIPFIDKTAQDHFEEQHTTKDFIPHFIPIMEQVFKEFTEKIEAILPKIDDSSPKKEEIE